jgi:hypothetical protein
MEDSLGGSGLSFLHLCIGGCILPLRLCGDSRLGCPLRVSEG